MAVHSFWKYLDGAPDLICSDNPVSVSWKGDAVASYGPGFGMPGTTLTQPLHRRVALVAMFEKRPPAGWIDIQGVAAINAATARNAVQIYSTGEEFVYLGSDGVVRWTADLLDHLRRKPHKSERSSAASPGRPLLQLRPPRR